MELRKRGSVRPARRSAGGSPQTGLRSTSARLPLLLLLPLLALGGLLGPGCRCQPPTEPVPATPAGPTPPFVGPAPADALREPAGPQLRVGRYGGELVLSTPADPKTFNPLLANEESTTAVLFPLVHTTLTRWDPWTGRDEPELARSWQVSADGLSYSFTLRRGLRWSDGAPFTADDVLFNLQLLADPALPNSLADLFRDGQGRLPRWEKLDDWTVRAVLAEVNVLFVAAVGSVYLAPRHRLEAAWRAGRFAQAWSIATSPGELAGLGPFRIAAFQPGQRLVLERNPYYWKVDARGQRLPYLDRVIWTVVPDFNAALLRFEQGELDVFEEVQSEQIDRLAQREQAGGYKLWDLGPSLTSNYLSFNWDPGNGPDGRPRVDPRRRAWFADVRFRRAISHAIDREGLVSTALLGRGRPLYCFDSESNRLWAHRCTRYPHDPAAAAGLLDQLGLKDTDGDGVRDDGRGNPLAFTTITNAENRERVAVGTVLQEDLARVGIRMALRPLPFNSLVTTLRETRDWEAVIGAWGSAVPPDPVLGKHIFLSSGQLHLWSPEQATPATPWEAQIDRLVAVVAGTIDLPRRQAAYHELSELLAQQQAQIFTYNSNQYVATRRGLANLRPTVFRPYSYWNAHLLFWEQ